MNNSNKTKGLNDLRRLGINNGDVVLVHASLKSMAKYNIDPESIINILLEAIGSSGTLLMPALSYQQIPAYIHSTLDTPSNVGAIAEYFRQRVATMRSIHPTHSVCGIGPRTQELLAGHENDTTPCGQMSPFRKILNFDAKIIMLGCGLEPNTTMHALEELVDTPYWADDTGLYEYQITDSCGKRYNKRYRKHGFQGKWIQRYERLESLASPELYASGTVLGAETFVINTQVLKKIVVAKLQQEPFFFVDKKGK
jgi:aminoglycoside 3-N-acetyltransferase